MNELNLLMTMMGTISAEAPVASAGVPRVDDSGAFGNLLDLVSDLEVADSQMSLRDEANEEGVQDLFDPAWNSIEKGAQQIGLSSWPLLESQLTPQTVQPVTVGQSEIKSLPREMPAQIETTTAKEWLLESGDLEMKGSQELARMSQRTGDFRAESVVHWATALASGDVKKVVVDPIEAPKPTHSMPSEDQLSLSLPLDPVSPEKEFFLGKAESSRSNPERSPLVRQEKVSVPLATAPTPTRAPAPAPAPVLASAPVLAPAPTPVPTTAIAKEAPKQDLSPNSLPAPMPELESSEAAPARAEFKSTSSSAPKGQVSRSRVPEGDFVAFKDESGSSDFGWSSDQSDKKFTKLNSETTPRREVRSDFEAPASSESGSEFLLRRADEAFSGRADSMKSSLVSVETLGSPGDRRLSPQSVDFVAERISKLQEQGGGQLRVELNPGQLGAIEIRVRQVRGSIQVELLAERPETLKALGEAKSEISAKLLTSSSASLEVRALPTRIREFPVSQGAQEMPASEMLSIKQKTEVRAPTGMEPHREIQMESQLGESVRRISDAGAAVVGLSDRLSARESSGSSVRASESANGREAFSQGQREERRGRAMSEWSELIFARQSA